jgi:hypothetical protein
MSLVDKIISVVGVLASLATAAIFLRASFIEVPNNIDTFIDELQRIGRWNSAGCFAAFVAALCAAYAFFRTL